MESSKGVFVDKGFNGRGVCGWEDGVINTSRLLERRKTGSSVFFSSPKGIQECCVDKCVNTDTERKEGTYYRLHSWSLFLLL